MLLKDKTMRYFSLALSLFLLIGISCQNKKNRGAPEKIKEAFFKLNPNATVTKWNDEPPMWEAKYKDGNEKRGGFPRHKW